MYSGGYESAMRIPVSYTHLDVYKRQVRESVEYTSPYQFEKDIKEENYYGVPFTVVFYKDKDGNTIPQDFISELAPPQDVYKRQVTTDEMGFAESKELYLGKYEVKEVKAGYGMVLSSEVHTVELIYAGQNVAVTETATSFVNERQKVEVSLEKALETNELFGIGNNGEIKNLSLIHI